MCPQAAADIGSPSLPWEGKMSQTLLRKERSILKSTKKIKGGKKKTDLQLEMLGHKLFFSLCFFLFPHLPVFLAKLLPILAASLLSCSLLHFSGAREPPAKPLCGHSRRVMSLTVPLAAGCLQSKAAGEGAGRGKKTVADFS